MINLHDTSFMHVAGNDAEKDRLAHKMAFGKDKDPENPGPKAKNKQNARSDRKETVDDLKQRRFEECKLLSYIYMI